MDELERLCETANLVVANVPEIGILLPNNQRQHRT